MVFGRYHTKRETAFLMSFQAIWESSPRCYFWTFTPHCWMHDWQFAKAWNRFLIRWNKWGYGEGFKGLRVFEPFQSGQLHSHAVINTRFAVDAMRRVAVGTGIGRIHVRRAYPHDAEYLAKYMFKLSGKLPDNIRAWDKIGTWRHTAIRNVEIKSTQAEMVRYAYNIVFSGEARQTVRFMRSRRWAQRMYAEHLRSDSYDVVTASPTISEPSYNVVTREIQTALVGV